MEHVEEKIEKSNEGLKKSTSGGCEAAERVFGDYCRCETESKASLRSDISLMKGHLRQLARELTEKDDEISEILHEIDSLSRFGTQQADKLNRVAGTLRACAAVIIVLLLATPLFIFAVIAFIKPAVLAGIGVYAAASLFILWKIYRMEVELNADDR